MRITMARAMTRGDSGYKPCGWCEAGFGPRTIMVSADPWFDESCPECAEAVLRRKERGGVAADWPTWEQYQKALREYPDFMMTEEELDRADELGLYDDFYELAQLHG